MAKRSDNQYELSQQSDTACNNGVILPVNRFLPVMKMYFSHLSDRSGKWWTIDSTSFQEFDTNERKIVCFNMTEGSCIENEEFMVYSKRISKTSQ